MKADLSRNTFDPLKHFTRVLLQQGRVQLDTDWNEQTAILVRYLRSLAADLIGQHGGPDEKSFAISPISPGDGISRDFVIGAGHYFVDGILCEADSELIPITQFFDDDKTLQVLYWPLGDLAFRKEQYVEVSDAAGSVTAIVQAKVTGYDAANRTLTLDRDVKPTLSSASQPRLRQLTTYFTQPDYAVPDKFNKSNYQVYIDVWERLITHVEDGSIREVALGGSDTAARSKVVWQVKTTDLKESTVCMTVDQLKEQFQRANRGWLKASAKQDSTSTEPCIISPDSRYRGPENQLYRVEIHRSGSVAGHTAQAATFKWSRENGSAIYPIISLSSGAGSTTISLETLGRDDRFGLNEGDWLEVVDDDSVLLNRAEILLKIYAIDRPNMTVTLDGSLTSNVGQNAAKHPLVRRWDHKEGDPDKGGLQFSGGAALIIEDKWLKLEDGVKIQFQKPDVKQPLNNYRTGDYWLIPARTATGDVEWPREYVGHGEPVPIAKPPDGISHHYAPLAVISVSDDGEIKPIGDGSCRKVFRP